jgi:hypothetical protein
LEDVGDRKPSFDVINEQDLTIPWIIREKKGRHRWEMTLHSLALSAEVQEIKESIVDCCACSEVIAVVVWLGMFDISPIRRHHTH